MKIRGKSFKYGDNVNTDEIIPARYLNSSDPQWLAAHCMEDLDANFINEKKPGDIIVARKNFGCGSSREHAPIAIKAAEISCIIADSFARIFYRNAINTGLPIIECSGAAADIEKGDQLEVNLDSGTIKNLRTKKTYSFEPMPPFAQEIIKAGGLMKYIMKNKQKQ
jgi:3-isopropylmalate/(R)-2-methylmalate dehydratase small subunit